MLVNFTTMKTKKLNITQIPHISAHFNSYHVKEHQKLSCKLSSLILCGLVFSCNLQKCCKNPKYTISTETQNSSNFLYLISWCSGLRLQTSFCPNGHGFESQHKPTFFLLFKFINNSILLKMSTTSNPEGF